MGRRLLTAYVLFLVVCPAFADDRPVAFVTGAYRGLGQAIAEEFLAKGYRVVLAGRNPGALEGGPLKNHPDVLPLTLDLTRPETFDAAVTEAVSRFGKIDVLVHNAGLLTYGSAETMPVGQIETSFQTNTLGPIALTQKVLPHMRDRKKGRILYISSLSSSMREPSFGAYAASKAASEAYLETLRTELRADPKAKDIFISVLRVGFVNSDYDPKIRFATDGRDTEDSAQEASAFLRFLRSFSPTTEKTVARAVLKTAEARRPKDRVNVGWDGKILELASYLPSSLVHGCVTLIGRLAGRRAPSP